MGKLATKKKREGGRRDLLGKKKSPGNQGTEKGD